MIAESPKEKVREHNSKMIGRRLERLGYSEAVRRLAKEYGKKNILNKRKEEHGVSS